MKFSLKQSRLYLEKIVKIFVETLLPQRDKIPLFIFEQLFRKDTQGLKLGEKVRAEIEERALKAP